MAYREVREVTFCNRNVCNIHGKCEVYFTQQIELGTA
jgi:hypothetical protein